MASSYAYPQSTLRPQTILAAGGSSRFLEGSRPRYGYRIALKEDYTPYYNLKTLKTTFEALRDTIIVLRTCWSQGYMGRDISVANVLWDEKSKCASLVDLDLVAHADSTRIGTPYFMATELYGGEYLFKPEEDKPPTPEEGLIKDSNLPASNFRYNPLHDLESVWWLAAWTLCRHVPKSGFDFRTRDEFWKLYHQQKIYEQTFCARSYSNLDMRPTIFLYSDEVKFKRLGSFQDLEEYLLEAYSSAIKYINIFANCLRRHYHAAESDIATLHENKFETLHQDLIDVVTEFLSLMPDELEILPLTEAEIFLSKQRNMELSLRNHNTQRS